MSIDEELLNKILAIYKKNILITKMGLFQNVSMLWKPTNINYHINTSKGKKKAYDHLKILGDLWVCRTYFGDFKGCQNSFWMWAGLSDSLSIDRMWQKQCPLTSKGKDKRIASFRLSLSLDCSHWEKPADMLQGYSSS